MPALTPKPDVDRGGWNVRFGSKADIRAAKSHVYFVPDSDTGCVVRHVRYGPEANAFDWIKGQLAKTCGGYIL
jgi:hypothetical protein